MSLKPDFTVSRFPDRRAGNKSVSPFFYSRCAAVPLNARTYIHTEGQFLIPARGPRIRETPVLRLGRLAGEKKNRGKKEEETEQRKERRSERVKIVLGNAAVSSSRRQASKESERKKEGERKEKNRTR